MSTPGALPTNAEQLVATLGPLPPTAQVLARLQGLLADPNSGMDDIAALVRLDAAMTTRVVKISNSAWFGRGLPCHTIEESVNRIGFREVFQLVSVVASGSLFAQPLAAYGRDASVQWHESVACAYASELLAERLGEDTATCFMNGLLHAIGRSAINKVAVREGRTLDDSGFPLDFSSAEFALLGFTQADAGGAMLKKWNFTPDTIEPVRRQYEPLEAGEHFDRLSAILFAARLLRSAVQGRAHDAPVPGEPEILDCLRLTRDEVMEQLPPLQEKLSRAEQIAKI